MIAGAIVGGVNGFTTGYNENSPEEKQINTKMFELIHIYMFCRYLNNSFSQYIMTANILKNQNVDSICKPGAYNRINLTKDEIRQKLAAGYTICE